MSIAAPTMTSAADWAAYLNATYASDPRFPWVADDSSEAWAADYGEIAVWVAEGAHISQLINLLGYLVRGPLNGEWFDGLAQEVVAGYGYAFEVDTTKWGRDDPPAAWAAHRHWLVEGTPVRRTDRAGAGTAGTRAHPGLGPVFVAWR